jgi:ABC-2 type transport system permease protein
VTSASTSVTRERSQLPRLIAHEFRSEGRCFWRNSQARFFTIAMPLLILVIFGSVFRSQNVAVPGGRINESVYYVPGVIAYGVIVATFLNLLIGVVRYRETGIYKRRRATPVPASAIILGRAVVGVVIAITLTVVLLGIGWAFFGATIPVDTLPTFVLDVIVGAAVFCCLGFAVATLVTNVESAQPVGLGIVLTLCFVSGVFIPILELPRWLVDAGEFFPVRALAGSLLAAYNPHTAGTGLDWTYLGILAAWGALGFVVATRRFRWLPRGE